MACTGAILLCFYVRDTGSVYESLFMRYIRLENICSIADVIKILVHALVQSPLTSGVVILIQISYLEKNTSHNFRACPMMVRNYYAFLAYHTKKPLAYVINLIYAH
jgi:hypothetical protein